VSLAELTIIEALERAADLAPTHGYTFCNETGDHFFTFPEMARNAARYGAALRRRGLRRGDRVALVLPDTTEFVSSFLGCMHAGLVPVPMYPPLRAGQLGYYLDHARHILARAGASLLVTSPQIRSVLGSLVDGQLRSIAAMASLGIDDRTCEAEKVGLGDSAFLQFTSGSTARPKGVQLTYGNLAAQSKCIRDGIRLTEEDTGLAWLPLYHDMGLIGFVLAPLYTLTSVVFLQPFQFLKQPASWLRRMSRHRGSVSFSPNFGYGLCTSRVRPNELESLDLSAWRIAGCGAEPIQRKTLDAFAEKFARAGFRKNAFVHAYGMAENTLAISFSPWGSEPRYADLDHDALSTGKVAKYATDGAKSITLANCGRAFEGHEIAIFDGHRNPRGDRLVGQIAVRGPSVMEGYYRDPDATAAVMHDGWLLTGDQGFLVDGDLFVCGRDKELIIVAGRNYHPADIEWIAAEVPGIRRGRVIAFAVTSVGDDGSSSEGVVVCAESKTRGEEREALADAVKARVLDQLGLKVAQVVLLQRGSLPRTSSGKLQRMKTRERYLAGRLEVAEADESRLMLLCRFLLSQWGFLRGWVRSAVAKPRFERGGPAETTPPPRAPAAS
jgi:fatty-acyl-CoA synthase